MAAELLAGDRADILLDCLQDLGYTGFDGTDDEVEALTAAVDGGVASSNFTTLCCYLSSAIEADPEDPSLFMMDMRGFLQELGCVYTSLLEPAAFDT
eukprot:gene10072-22575_t